MNDAKIRELFGDIFTANGELDGEKIKKEHNKKATKANILLVGQTGVGKSTLINAIFGFTAEDEKAPTGVGEPQTQDISKYEHPQKDVILWDTKGIEAKDYEETLNKIKEIIQSQERNKNVSNAIHLAWLCIAESSDRVEERDKEILKFLIGEKIPTIVVLTKPNVLQYGDSPSDSNLLNYCKDNLKGAKAYLRVNALAVNNPMIKINQFGLDELLNESYQNVDEGIANAIKKSQKINKEEKKQAMIKEAREGVHLHAGAAATVGASPIPFSDAPLLAAVQTKMIYSLNRTFQVDLEDSVSTSLITGVLGITAVASVGKSVVTGLIKFIPGAGTVVGGAISATVGAGITEALGHAYIEVLSYLYDQSESGQIKIGSANRILDLVKEYYKKP